GGGTCSFVEICLICSDEYDCLFMIIITEAADIVHNLTGSFTILFISQIAVVIDRVHVPGVQEQKISCDDKSRIPDQTFFVQGFFQNIEERCGAHQRQ